MTTETATTSPSAASGLNPFKPRVLHVAYFVDDIDRALAFYIGVLGMQEQMRIPLGEGKQEVILQFPNSKGSGVILMWNTRRTEPHAHGDAYSRIVLLVSDVDQSVAHVVKHGAPVVTPVTSAGPMKYAMVKDPDGYVIELLELPRG